MKDKRKELIEDLLSVDDSPPPDEALVYIAMMCDLCARAAAELERDDLKFRQLAEINDEMTNMVMVQSRHLREYEEMFKVKRLRGI